MSFHTHTHTHTHCLYLGLVLALNARIVAMKPNAFDRFLIEFPLSEILVWTGSGEPKIPIQDIKTIIQHFHTMGNISRLSFDCDIE